MLSDDEYTDISAAAIRSRWGVEAWECLKQIRGANYEKRRRTLLLMADYKLAGKSLNAVFGRNDAISERIHYKHKANDSAYAAAFDFLIGSDDAPGLVLRELERRSELESVSVIGAVEAAQRRLVLLSPAAVEAFADGLEAVTTLYATDKGRVVFEKEIPDHTTRLRAADMITRRVPGLQPGSTADVMSGGEQLQAIAVIAMPTEDL
ncbi:MAG: hypothetical protein M9928_21770 [Anaerolineae bacterium]|nr:hypothetical protein [Anaerolineae bacterium]MCO5195451.1 hypothetical protein [Anaerolineae bacterium]MCO5199991.1 hypothetical protein [Anaerolineae bacterium]MCO5207645.1 hypothetical protein [Anaerolineae bacterium]